MKWRGGRFYSKIENDGARSGSHTYYNYHKHEREEEIPPKIMYKAEDSLYKWARIETVRKFNQ